jgi:thiamine-monophosphate kinase
MSEFNLIQKYFTRLMRHTDLGVGDDAALVKVADGMQLVVSTDMSVADTHFFHDAVPYDIGWKSLAVNVSDMAAMGAQAKWATLAIALPEVNENWLAEYSRGFFACADVFNIDLIGGDTTRGPLNISVTIMGEVPIGKAIRRSGAQVGDDIWVSGTLGSAALGLACLQNNTLQDKIGIENDALQASIHALCRPMPRANLGLSLRSIATSCIDISDGFLADLGHILKASNCGATIDLDKIPCIDYLKNNLQNSQFQDYLLAGGDDYELCFTAPPSKRDEIKLLSKQQNILLTRIANTRSPVSRMSIGLESGSLEVMYQNKPLSILKQGFDHFA